MACLLLAGSVLPVTAEDLIIQPGTDLWREMFDPPFTKPAEIPKDMPLRKQLFDLLRPKVERVAKQKVQFEGSLRAFKNWAMFTGRTLDTDGKSVKFPDLGNDDTAALWLRTNEGWRLIDHSTGHSDAFFAIWHEQYGAPKELVELE
jgi:hypothetical protein